MGCDKCDRGWCSVSETYVEKSYPMPTPGTDGYDEAVRQCEMKRASARGTVYPCKVCQPTLFYRWAGGHLDKDHERGGCDECSSPSSASRRRRRTSSAHEEEPMPEPPPDLDAVPPLTQGTF